MSFQLIPELRVGHVVEVAGTSVRAELDIEVDELSRGYQGRVYPIGQIGSMVKIHIGRRLVFGFVTLLRMRSEEEAQAGAPPAPQPDRKRPF